MDHARIDVHPHASAADAPAKPSEAPRYPVDADAIGPAIGPVLDALEQAMARALEAAAIAGRFDVVSQLAEELRARRLAAAGNVVELSGRKQGR